MGGSGRRWEEVGGGGRRLEVGGGWRRWEEVGGGGSRPDRRYSKMGRERMSKMRELFKTCPKIQFFGLSSCFQDCRGGGGGGV